MHWDREFGGVYQAVAGCASLRGTSTTGYIEGRPATAVSLGVHFNKHTVSTYPLPVIPHALFFYSRSIPMPWSALGQEPLNATAQWEGEGSGRGTWTIFSTCVVTLILCVWTAVHLNVPQYGHAESRVWRKIGMMLMALYGPEVVSIA